VIHINVNPFAESAHAGLRAIAVGERKICADYSGRPSNCNGAAAFRARLPGMDSPDMSAPKFPRSTTMSRSPKKAPKTPRPQRLNAARRPKPPATDGAAATATLTRIAGALEQIALALPGAAANPSLEQPLAAADAFVWNPNGRLTPVPRVSRVDIGLLRGIDRMRDILIENTERFATGLPANNALLWGARGMGKSSLVKAAHATVNARPDVAGRLKLIEIHREDIESLPALMLLLRQSEFRFLVFCDDLSFDGNDASYKSLKAVLEGGIEGRPENVLLYATSNRRHLLARDMIENERSTSINPGEAVEEKVSLSDRFGLWLGFHRCSQDEYLAMVRGYCDHFGIAIAEDELTRDALEWSTTRGSRSGRVAWQYVQDLAGRLGVRLVQPT
jgi:predicted AAA+ superfamily ATPase